MYCRVPRLIPEKKKKGRFFQLVSKNSFFLSLVVQINKCHQFVEYYYFNTVLLQTNIVKKTKKPQTEYLWAVVPFLWAKKNMLSASQGRLTRTITSEGEEGEHTEQSKETRSSLEGAAVAPEHVAIALEEGIAFETSP